MMRDDVQGAIARKLAERRSELRLSLAQLSRRCGVTLQQIHKYETGQSVISAPMLWKLAKCLGVPVTYFFDGLEDSAGVSRRAKKADRDPSASFDLSSDGF